MPRLNQTFESRTNRPRLIMLELSTARFRSGPREELVLHYDSEEVQDEPGSALRVDLVEAGKRVEMSVRTFERAEVTG